MRAVETKEVLALALMYAARGYADFGWRDGLGREVVSIYDWEWVETTDACGAVTLACLDIFGRWYDVPQYDEAVRACLRAGEFKDFDQWVNYEYDFGTQEWAMDMLSRAVEDAL